MATEKPALEAPDTGIERATGQSRNTPQASFNQNVLDLTEAVKREGSGPRLNEEFPNDPWLSRKGDNAGDAQQGKQNESAGIPEGLPARETTDSQRLTQRFNKWLGRSALATGSRFREIARHDLPNALARALSALERVTGQRIVVIRNLTPKIQDFNGLTFKDGVLYINESAQHPLVAVGAHEFVHNLKRDHPDLYQQLEDEVRRQGRLDQWEADLRKRAQGEDVNAKTALEELTGNAVGDALIDPVFLEKLAQRNPGKFRDLVRRFMDYLNTLLGRVRDLGSNRYMTDVQRFRDVLADVLDKYDPGGAGTPLKKGTTHVEVDGVQRPVRNSNGGLISASVEGVRNFWRWYSGQHDGNNGSGTSVPDHSGATEGLRLVGRGRASRLSLRGQTSVATPDGGAGQVGTVSRSRATGPVGQDQTPVVFYHGTKDDVDAFDLNHPNRKDAGWLGRGVYGFDSPDGAELYANNKRGSGDPRIMPLYFAVKRPFVVSSELKTRLKHFSQAGIDRFTADLKAQGYDGAVHRVASDALEIVAFDPAQVKSAIGNRGTFDPNNPDIRFSRSETADVENPPSVLSRVNPDRTGIHPQAGFDQNVVDLIETVKGSDEPTFSRRESDPTMDAVSSLATSRGASPCGAPLAANSSRLRPNASHLRL